MHTRRKKYFSNTFGSLPSHLVAVERFERNKSLHAVKADLLFNEYVFVNPASSLRASGIFPIHDMARLVTSIRSSAVLLTHYSSS